VKVPAYMQSPIYMMLLEMVSLGPVVWQLLLVRSICAVLTGSSKKAKEKHGKPADVWGWTSPWAHQCATSSGEMHEYLDAISVVTFDH
jgi:hypothetical protein